MPIRDEGDTAVFSVLIVAEESAKRQKLCAELARAGFKCQSVQDAELPAEDVEQRAPDLVLVEMDGHSADHSRELLRKLKSRENLPIIALVDRNRLGSLDSDLGMDDFVVEPCDVTELALRVKRLLHKNMNGDELVTCGDLVIDLAACEVTIGGRLVMLTFKEYELLKFLASNKGRVFSRDTLLNKVWGYDYYGGDRTVDVHIRRLRSKIEDAAHLFIETVRNIGYRFRDDA